MRERTSVTALWSDGERCHGVLTDGGPIAAAATVLATGGAAALWRRTTNPRGAIGAGPVLAAAAGADLADLEFCQFHPTALSLPGTRFDGVLITEAVRGEGATLLDAAGERFTDELAPARRGHRGDPRPDAGRRQRRRSKLDLREIDPARFPNVFASLAEAGLDPRAEPVPVAPAAHYTMGGIAVDLDGRSSLPGPLRGRRVLLHRPARRQPARLQLAQRVLRLRRPRRRRGGRRGERGGEPPAAAGVALRAADRGRPATRSGASPARCATPTTWRALLANPYPLAAAIATCALERRESRGGHLRSDCPEHRPRARRRPLRPRRRRRGPPRASGD